MKRVSRSLATECMFDHAAPPVLRVEPGEPFVLETQDCFGGVLTDEDHLPDKTNLPGMFATPPQANYLTGPVYIEGAEPGDTLAVTIEQLLPVGQGVSILSPMAGGILFDTAEWADALPLATKIVSLLPGPSGTTRDGLGDLGHGKLVPLAPMIGTIGVAPRGSGFLQQAARDRGVAIWIAGTFGKGPRSPSTVTTTVGSSRSVTSTACKGRGSSVAVHVMFQPM